MPFVNLLSHLVGVRLGLFTPDQAFDVVAKKQIEMLKSPSLKLIDLVSVEMMKVVQGAVTKVLSCIIVFWWGLQCCSAVQLGKCLLLLDCLTLIFLF